MSFQDVSIMVSSLEKFFQSKVKQMPPVEFALIILDWEVFASTEITLGPANVKAQFMAPRLRSLKLARLGA